MQLRLRPRPSRNFVAKSFIIKTILFVLIFFIAIFLLDKIDMPTPTKLIKQEISHDKIIKVK
jgi:hypothetical protein|tara:strand:- start:4359 stop:4544 length:186 start_codon:yes stop_codon:yes gene_type:complete